VAADDLVHPVERLLGGGTERLRIAGRQLETAREHRDGAPRLAGRRLPELAPLRGAERRVLREDLLLELLQGGARLDPELVDEPPAALLEDVERLGLTARAVERQHQLCAAPLAVRLGPNQRLEFCDGLGVPPEREVDFDPLLHRLGAELLEAGDLVLGVGVVGELGERRAAPERERLVERGGGLLDLTLGDRRLRA
jgi:hypothetical protein